MTHTKGKSWEINSKLILDFHLNMYLYIMMLVSKLKLRSASVFGSESKECEQAGKEG